MATPLDIVDRDDLPWRFIAAKAQYMPESGGEYRPKGSEIEAELLYGAEYL